MFSRYLDLIQPLQDLSLLLLGPRQTGKTTLLKMCFSKALVFDLLDPELFRDLNKSPTILKEMISAQDHDYSHRPIVIDEIQKLPELMDVVQSIITENKNSRFILTGSSARKLRAQGQNLLGGRAYPLFLHPITSHEFINRRQNQVKGSNSPAHINNDLHTLLQWGGLPSVLNSQMPHRILKAYVGIYLQEEIKAEGYARNLSDFSKFLEVAALTNSEQLDFSGVSRDVQLSPRTVAAYYQILQDTLIGYLLEPFRETKKRKAVTTPKFYYFDVGVCNFLTGREHLAQGTTEYGKALEHFIFTELIAYRDYNELNFELFYWRSTSQFEVDFVIRLKNGSLIGIEIKGSSHIDRDDLKGLKALEEDLPLAQKIVVCNEKHERLVEDQFKIVPYRIFCQKLWSRQII